MTEKRFAVDDGLEDVLCWEINDKENEDMTCGECVKLLNELYEENEQLKHDATVLIQANQDYRGENEQLKSENKRLKKDLEYCANQFKEDGKNILLNLR